MILIRHRSSVFAVIATFAAVLFAGTATANAAPVTPSMAPTGAATPMSIEGLCNYNGTHPTISYGDTGSAVSHAQCLLKNYHGYSYVSIDGIFGSDTRTAVKDLQARYGLTVDGIVGPATWDALHDV